ncbi:tyrosine-protein kinase YwqD [Geobacter sp. OR-1]|uniref:XrtA-associated tyrosine autokinase n=1 Tax=Geobacter sp. OR-1 TaxID=1266765 RepID=UPI0005426C24|nr:XrtA-associated tyrosine autokinase [Geobacter sp. OR-1]GAM10600.1 tyrosine-protein kinase YwqD [Geobacter sp. OR-1]
MSRIEKALEKASQLRQRMPDVQPEPVEFPPSTSNVQASSEYPLQTVVTEISNPLLVSITDSSSPISEEYRKLKSLLVATAKERDFANVIMVTSAIAGEGKSITALNLALSLAQEMDHTVLLIDADLRKPSINNYLGINGDIGLAEVLEDRSDLPSALKHTGVGKLVVLPAGRVTLNPVELFTSQRMVKLIQEIKHRYPDRFVVIDTPPILPFAETRTISRLVDGVIFVVKERLASQSSIAEAIEALEGAKKIGIVYNEAEISVADDRYGHYYNRYYQKQNDQK